MLRIIGHLTRLTPVPASNPTEVAEQPGRDMNQIAVLLERTVVVDDNSNRNLVLTNEPTNTAKDRVA